MKRLLTAAVAATLMCGTAAFAQDSQAGAQPPGAQPPGVTDTQSGNTVVVSNAPAGQPPADYPPCTHKGEDRCVAGGGAEHGKAHHHRKAKASQAASDASPGA